MKLTVLLLICSSSAPVCDANTARAVQSFYAPDGVIVCGAPSVISVVETAVRPDASEYVKVRCELK